MQEGGEALFRILLGEQQYHLLVTHDLVAHQAHDLLAELRHLAGEIVEHIERDLAHHGGFQRLGEGGVCLLVDGIETDQIPREVEGGDLLVTLFCDGV
ncbi:hypothetical protein D3C72_2130210 [compost metagenome]